MASRFDFAKDHLTSLNLTEAKPDFISDDGCGEKLDWPE